MSLPPGTKAGYTYDFADIFNTYVHADANRGPRYELVPAGGTCPEEKRGRMKGSITCGMYRFVSMGRLGKLTGEAEKEFRRIGGFKT